MIILLLIIIIIIIIIIKSHVFHKLMLCYEFFE